MMGNVRDSKQVNVIVPDQMDKLLLESAKVQPQANGRDYFNVTMKIVDRNGTLVSTRTPVTLDSSIGKIELTDLDPKQPGIQVFVEGGTLVVPIKAPIEAGEGTLSVESGIFHSSTPIRFLPDLRPIIAVGLVEGSLNFKKFDPKQLSNVGSQDGFEEELQEISSSDNGKSNVTGRAAMFLKGKVRGEYLLTLAYDSDKDKTSACSVIFVQMNIIQFMVTRRRKVLMHKQPVSSTCVWIKAVLMPCMVIMLPVLKMMRAWL